MLSFPRIEDACDAGFFVPLSFTQRASPEYG